MSRYADGQYAVYVETVRKARKVHRCDACKLPIRVGDYYCSVHTVYDGEADTIKRCGACQLTHVHLRGLVEGDMWPDERLACGDEYLDNWGHLPPNKIARLPFLSDAERGALLAGRKATRPPRWYWWQWLGPVVARQPFHRGWP